MHARSPLRDSRPTAVATAARPSRPWRRPRDVGLHADRRLRVPVGLPHRRAGGPRRGGRLALDSRASTRRASSPRCWTAAPASSASAPYGVYVPTAPPLPAGHQRARDDLDDAQRLAGRPRRAGDRPVARGRRRRPADPPADRPRGRADAACGSSSACRARSSSRCVCEPMFDYAREPAVWEMKSDEHGGLAHGKGKHHPAARSRRSGMASNLRLGHRGLARARASHAMSEGEKCFVALGWAADLVVPADRRRGRGLDRPDRPLLAHLAGRRRLPRPSVGRPPAALGAGAEGPDLRADGRAGRRADDVAARDAGRRAQLGLPLHVDARRDVHALRAARARPRLGGRRLHAVRRRPRMQRGRLAADHVRHRRRARPHRADARPPARLRALAAGADRQRRVRRSARTTSSAP